MNDNKNELSRKVEERRMERVVAFKNGDLDAYERLEPPLLDQGTSNNYIFCDDLDAVPKDDIGSMEYPMFSLSKNQDHTIREYTYNGRTVTIVPGGYGLATIWDKDILIYCTSQLIAAQERGQPISRTLWIRGNDLLKSIMRRTDGRNCANIKAALNRLSGTRITTDITTNGKRTHAGFGLIDRWEMVTAVGDENRTIAIEVVISEWLYNAILSNEVLSLPKAYFLLTKAHERRLYELARKHCGKQASWQISLTKLHTKTGSTCTLKEFRRKIKAIAEENPLPDYKLVYQPESDMVRFYSRKAKGTLKEVHDILDHPRRKKPGQSTNQSARRSGSAVILDHPRK
ncbi:MAG: replication initiator protein A [Lamprobacter sp.]|uniref:replication initiator protein A n=1 Tax=Lamprobacter sp. TaxID=3100796 RepID=UPI002B262A94|nr:replication initiator protein A [Lamprobacter sp.]MEA3641766.1 replication initiator protein A [Lamprobacter sp.]